MQVHRVFHTGAVTSLVILCVWLLAWEIGVAPLHPGGSLLALKALPLLLPLRGVIKRDLYTLQWSSMVILIYFVEGAVRVDLDHVPALADEREALWAQVTAADFLSRAEKRKLLGVER